MGKKKGKDGKGWKGISPGPRRKPFLPDLSGRHILFPSAQEVPNAKKTQELEKKEYEVETLRLL